jgi:hypothetical protein
VLDYMRKGDLPKFRYRQGRPQFNASSSISNSVPLRIQLKDIMDEQAKASLSGGFIDIKWLPCEHF